MDILEIEQKERVGPRGGAARLKRLTDMLARDNEIVFGRGGLHSPGPACTGSIRCAKAR